MKLPPDHTAVFKAAELVVVRRDHRAKVLLDDLRMLAQARIHIKEYDALRFQILLDIVINRLAVVLRRYAMQELLLGFRNAELVEGVFDFLRNIVPVAFCLVRRPHVIVDVVVVDLVQVPRPIAASACP